MTKSLGSSFFKIIDSQVWNLKFWSLEFVWYLCFVI